MSENFQAHSGPLPPVSPVRSPCRPQWCPGAPGPSAAGLCLQPLSLHGGSETGSEGRRRNSLSSVLSECTRVPESTCQGSVPPADPPENGHSSGPRVRQRHPAIVSDPGGEQRRQFHRLYQEMSTYSVLKMYQQKCMNAGDAGKRLELISKRR